jgi:hypothetical protein
VTWYQAVPDITARCALRRNRPRFHPNPPQICDFDLCDTCVLPAVASPPLGRLPSPRVLLAKVSPFRSTLVAPIQSPVHVVVPINISSDESPPPPPKIHPFFIRREVQLAEETHEMRFHALVRQPAQTNALPHRRANGRLRLRVSTPVVPPQVAHTASAPRRPPCRMRLPTADCCISPLQYPDLAGLAISTPPRVGCPHFQPRLLFPDSPLSPVILVADNSPASHHVVQNCDVCVQTVPPHEVPSRISVAVQTDILRDAAAHQSLQPLTLQHFQNELQVLRDELRVLVMGFGF